MRGALKFRVAVGLFVSLITVTASVTYGFANEDRSFLIVDSFGEGVSGSSEIYAMPEDQVQAIINNKESNYLPTRKFCETLTSGPCAEPTGLSLRIYLPVCDATIVNYCIESLGISSGGDQQVQQIQQGQLLGYSGGRIYAADPAKGVPQASAPSLWKVPNINNKAGTDTYTAKLLLDGFLSVKSNKLYVFAVSAIVEPYVNKPLSNNSSDCNSWQSSTACGQRTDFVPGQQAQLTVRLPNTVTGWLHGRFKGATIAVDKFDANQNRLTVTAENVVVPELSTTLTEAQFQSLPNPAFFTTNGSTWRSVNAGNPAALEWVKQFATVLKDTATGEHTTWSFSTIPPVSGGNQCFQDKTRLIGLVMTNALVYSPGAPDFDGKQLNYQVGGFHFKPDGTTLTTGTYDLLMRSDSARCLYNFTDAPISASVSVTTASGQEQQIATTVLSEKGGWLHLSATGFTFSTPMLRVKLTGTPKVLPKQNNSNNSNQNKNSNKRYVLTCIKGKVVKKMTVPEPRCPIGWKKK